MANVRGKALDKTMLSVDQAEKRGFLHRDYLAHCFRWSHVVKYMGQQQRYKTAKILDIGCGKDIALAKTLYTSRMAPETYVGIDMNKLEMPDMFANAKWEPELITESDVCNIVYGMQMNTSSGVIKMKNFNTIISFEVIEHVEPEQCIRILKKIFELLSVDGISFISTPDWDPQTGAAANHVNEMKMEALGWVIEECGFEIQDYWGTFASQREYKDLLVPDIISQKYWNQLSSYYDSNVLACIFAPLFPHNSRNVMWKLGIASDIYARQFPNIKYVDSPWTSSKHWEDLAHV